MAVMQYELSDIWQNIPSRIHMVVVDGLPSIRYQDISNHRDDIICSASISVFVNLKQSLDMYNSHNTENHQFHQCSKFVEKNLDVLIGIS